MDFKTWFCLNQRETFTIDPKINPADARLYIRSRPAGEADEAANLACLRRSLGAEDDGLGTRRWFVIRRTAAHSSWTCGCGQRGRRFLEHAQPHPRARLGEPDHAKARLPQAALRARERQRDEQPGNARQTTDRACDQAGSVSPPFDAQTRDYVKNRLTDRLYHDLRKAVLESANGAAVHMEIQDVYLADAKDVWEMTIGGYPVVKKWLSYREHKTLGRPLRLEEVTYVTEVVRRLQALLMLGEELDLSYHHSAGSSIQLTSARSSRGTG